MNNRLAQAWIPLDRVEALLQLEPALIMLGLVVGALLIYKIFLRSVSDQRHRNLRILFSNLFGYVIIWLILFSGFYTLQRVEVEDHYALERVLSYVGFLALMTGAVVIVKVSRILLFEYLFIGHMKEGVPVLLVNLASLIMSMIIGGWLVAEVFSIKLAPVLATSAIFSLVLGLALQETLGNLFSGVALQLDKPYSIGDWIEIQNGTTLWVGQVHEISWRATTLIALGDEYITVPNRVMAQAQISNFSHKTRPFLRRLVFRIPYDLPDGVTLKGLKEELVKNLLSIKGVKKTPVPLVLTPETHESWIPVRLIYSIEDYGMQQIIADEVVDSVLGLFAKLGVRPANTRILIQNEDQA